MEGKPSRARSIISRLQFSSGHTDHQAFPVRIGQRAQQIRVDQPQRRRGRADPQAQHRHHREREARRCARTERSAHRRSDPIPPPIPVRVSCTASSHHSRTAVRARSPASRSVVPRRASRPCRPPASGPAPGPRARRRTRGGSPAAGAGARGGRAHRAPHASPEGLQRLGRRDRRSSSASRATSARAASRPSRGEPVEAATSVSLLAAGRIDLLDPAPAIQPLDRAVERARARGPPGRPCDPARPGGCRARAWARPRGRAGCGTRRGVRGRRTWAPWPADNIVGRYYVARYCWTRAGSRQGCIAPSEEARRLFDRPVAGIACAHADPLGHRPGNVEHDDLRGRLRLPARREPAGAGHRRAAHADARDPVVRVRDGRPRRTRSSWARRP